MVRKIGKFRLTWDRLLDLGFYFWLFLLPWQTRLILFPGELNGEFWEYGTISLYLSEVVLIGVLFLYLIKLIRHGSLRWFLIVFKKSIFSKRINFVKVGLVIIIWLIISLFWSHDVIISLTRIIHLLLVFIAFFVILLRPLTWQIITIVFIAAGLIQGMLAINQFLEQQVFASSLLGMAEQLPHVYGVSVIQSGMARWLRAYGALPHPNILGGFLVFTIVFIYQNLFRIHLLDKKASEQYKKKIKIFSIGLYGSLIFIMSGLLLSFSRAAWLALFVSIVIIGINIIYKKRKDTLPFIKISLVLLLTTLVWFSIFPTPFVTRLQGREVLEKQSFEERGMSYTENQSILERYWLQGTGVGTYTKVLAEEFPDRKMSLNQPVHNSFLLILSEWGVVGFLGLIALFYLLLKRSPDKFWASISIISIAILMLFDHWWISLVFGNFFLLILISINLRTAKLIR